MLIRSIRLKNGYKRFKDLTIDLGDNPSRIVALVGPNGCGKSSVFDGMLFLQNAYSHVGNTGVQDYRYHSQNEQPDYNYGNIEINFANGPYEQVINEVAAGKKSPAPRFLWTVI